MLAFQKAVLTAIMVVENLGSSIVHENLDFMKGEGNFFFTQMSGDET
jgi:hypothetical protein